MDSECSGDSGNSDDDPPSPASCHRPFARADLRLTPVRFTLALDSPQSWPPLPSTVNQCRPLPCTDGPPPLSSTCWPPLIATVVPGLSSASCSTRPPPAATLSSLCCRTTTSLLHRLQCAPFLCHQVRHHLPSPRPQLPQQAFPLFLPTTLPQLPPLPALSPLPTASSSFLPFPQPSSSTFPPPSSTFPSAPPTDPHPQPTLLPPLAALHASIPPQLPSGGTAGLLSQSHGSPRSFAALADPRHHGATPPDPSIPHTPLGFRPAGAYEDKLAAFFTLDELRRANAVFAHSLVLKFSAGNPPLNRIRKRVAL